MIEFDGFRDEWKNLWKRIGGSGDSTEIYDDLIQHYSQPNRKYHNMAHIAHCLEEFDQIKESLDNPDLVEVAIWFHDAVYDPKNKDNEEKSAELAYKTLKHRDLSESFAQKVKEMIINSDHSGEVGDNDTKYLLDIDLAILGKPSDQFDEYEREIRDEYSDFIKEFSREEFIDERKRLLSNFLNRASESSIYRTEEFREKYESHRIKNLKTSLNRLDSE